jgi:hypothetical protein
MAEYIGAETTCFSASFGVSAMLAQWVGMKEKLLTVVN